MVRRDLPLLSVLFVQCAYATPSPYAPLTPIHAHTYIPMRSPSNKLFPLYTVSRHMAQLQLDVLFLPTEEFSRLRFRAKTDQIQTMRTQICIYKYKYFLSEGGCLQLVGSSSLR